MQNRRAFLKSTIATALAASAVPAFAGGHGRIGEFTGKSNHVTSGRAEVVVQGGKAEVILLDDFFFDGAPDPKVALGKDGHVGFLCKNCKNCKIANTENSKI